MQLKKIESFSSLKLAHPLFIKCFLSKSETTNSTLTKVGQNSASGEIPQRNWKHWICWKWPLRFYPKIYNSDDIWTNHIVVKNNLFCKTLSKLPNAVGQLLLSANIIQNFSKDADYGLQGLLLLSSLLQWTVF